jgi:hypothetical protein
MINNKYTKIAITVAMGLGFGTSAFADNTDTQTSTYTVDPINELEVAAPDMAFRITPTQAAAGETLSSVPSTTTSTWSLTTNTGVTKKLTAQLTTALKTGITLKVNMDAPAIGNKVEGTPSGTSAMLVDLSKTFADTTGGGDAVSVVTAIEKQASSGMGMAYEMTATVDAGELTNEVAEVTFTLINAV